MAFQDAVDTELYAKLAFTGAAGGGKTISALRCALAFGVDGKPPKIGVIQTERKAIQKYRGVFLDGIPFNFLVDESMLDADDFSPSRYTAAIKEAERCGIEVLIIDSLSHEWTGKGGCLDMVAKRGGKYTDWKDVTPMHDAMFRAIANAKMHIIATMRSEMDYVITEGVNRHGNRSNQPQAVGLAPVQRKGSEYEFDVVVSFEQKTHVMTVLKSRYFEIADKVEEKPGAAFWLPIADRLRKTKEAGAGTNNTTAPPQPMAGGKAIEPGTMGLRASVAATSANGNGRNDPRNGAELEKPAAQASPPPASGPITETQLREITRLIPALGMPADIAAESLRRKGVKDWDELTFGQANEVLDKMRAMELGLAPIPVSWTRPAPAPIAVGSGGADETAPFDA